MSEENGMIYKAISEAMEACQAVGKDSRNSQQGYQYRSIDAVMNAINPALRKAKIFCIPEVLNNSREERKTAKGNLLIYSIVTVKYTFFAADGSSVSAVVMGEGMDSGDKSFNKAMSAAFKYALFQVFCIPTEEMVDSERDSPEPAARAARETPQQRQAQQRQASSGNAGNSRQAAQQRQAQAPAQTSQQSRQQAPDQSGELISEKDQIYIESICTRRGWDPSAIFMDRRTGRSIWPNLTKAQYTAFMQEIEKRESKRSA